ncbi:MAG: methyltransferase domain-containing protein [Parcubacteria group bacterium]|nr:methyltransferase domain-containing protein [Parcubacteria group bacterium]MCR4342717.1 methyltransferase domain-containing protein [Patescibacteria group bacterium]
MKKIKLSYITGLRDIVLKEIGKNKDFHVFKECPDSVYLDNIEDLDNIRKLRSVARAYIVLQDTRYNPRHISNHKSVLGSLIDVIISNDESEFKTFKITCAGSYSPEARSIAKYIQDTYQIIEKEKADLKIHIIKQDDVWEIGIQITPRPLSLREYKVRNMSGAMDPTASYAVNSFCALDKAKTYLNVFSGSATLLIEAGQSYPNLEDLVGFDNNKKHLSLAIQNIKKAGLIKKIKVKEADIYDKPDFGKFDAITSDLPFGMSISKDEDLEKLYRSFIKYCQEALNPNGRLVVYTSEYETLEKVLQKSRFKITKSLELKFMTSVDAYLRPKIFVCRLK